MGSWILIQIPTLANEGKQHPEMHLLLRERVAFAFIVFLFFCAARRKTEFKMFCEHITRILSYFGPCLLHIWTGRPYECDGMIAAANRGFLQQDSMWARHSHSWVLENPTWPVEWMQMSAVLFVFTTTITASYPSPLRVLSFASKHVVYC